eukprot:TRINITY_DN1067_c0_g1_i1.p1 TRINITY_DN1067_c0_g1~~TRINITY_DN1067_c0_g1_i1.p1  ORF type:complete len:103 (+),score=28.77 TRINITY_DN1067_c0_g1_i1:1-309(+)
MKVMKGMKAMKKAKKNVGARFNVFKGKKEKTKTGLKKTDLMMSKSGKVVTKKSHAAGVRAYKNIKGWTAAVQKARKELGVKGFAAVKKGSALYKAARAHYDA